MSKSTPDEGFRRICVDIPDSVRCLFAKARELARLCGANSAVEEIEFLSVTMIQACEEQQSEWRRRATTPEAVFRLAVLERDGWRCRLCGTSRTLTCHHVVPRSECRMAGRLDLLVDARNGATLCARCHESVQPVWQQYVERLSNDERPRA